MGKPYEVPQLLYHLRVKERMSQREIADELDTSKKTIWRNLNKYDIEPHAIERPHPYDDVEYMTHLYETCEHQKAMAERLPCCEGTVSRRVREYGLKDYTPKNGVYRRFDRNGYVRYGIKNSDGSNTTVSESSLAALAAGEDPHEVFAEDTDMHHRNSRKIDNRPQNIKNIKREDHEDLHMNEVWTTEGGYPVIRET